VEGNKEIGMKEKRMKSNANKGKYFNIFSKLSRIPQW
jgi:hypothetical protein